ncbi:MAG TPA: hypothetical protein VEJ16_02915 [Alphaproteobacteria bacterium]|nr:hypothetical protein [Alphaproteobacteria bacterium]
MAEKTDMDFEKLRGELAQLRADLANITTTMQGLLRHGTDEAVSKARQSTERVQDEVKKRVESLAHEIEERPVGAAVTAFSVGLILGLLLGGRRA